MVQKLNGSQRIDERAAHDKLRSSVGTHGSVANDNICNVVAVAKRRDGGTRYWCVAHKANATAKYGKPAQRCRAANEPLLRPEEILNLNINEYGGGIALWGAVPAVYDTTRLPMDRGIHVHARKSGSSKKHVDFTYRAVRLTGGCLPASGILVQEIDAIYYMVTSVFGFEMRSVKCTYCNWPHLDRDWFSLHPHSRHLCAACGKHFQDSAKGIGNPIIGLRDAYNVRHHKTTVSKRRLNIRQSDYPGGIQIWGSNSALLWTNGKAEEEGIHVHVYSKDEQEPIFDETFGKVTIDGIDLNPEMIRVLMAQNVVPFLKDRIRFAICPTCKHQPFETGESAFSPSEFHRCKKCGER
jgi:hypothetical protein